MRIGSLCSGYGGLDMAVMEVFGGSMAWHCQYEPPDKHGREDKHQYAARILAHHWPEVPNHGDLTKVAWDQVEPVDILTAGFPCTDLSYAGLGAGIKEGTRSGLWLTIARAVHTLRPRLLVLENVRAIVNRRPGLDVVLADLARLGFDAEWLCVPASAVGGTHERYRWFLLAWPADAPRPRLEGAGVRGWAASGNRAASDTDRVGHERDRTAGQSQKRHAASADRFTAHAPRVGAGEPADQALPVAGGRHAWPVLGRRGGHAPADPAGIGDPDEPGNDVEAQFLAEPGTGDRADLGRRTEGTGELGRGAGVVAWGAYEPAIRRWEHILGRPAPRPTDDRGRLAPAFVEWMMGLPAGHVTDVPAAPDMTDSGLRNARLKALGNGVVPKQAVYALHLLRERTGWAVPT